MDPLTIALSSFELSAFTLFQICVFLSFLKLRGKLRPQIGSIWFFRGTLIKHPNMSGKDTGGPGDHAALARHHQIYLGWGCYGNSAACRSRHIWVFPKIVVPQNGWFIMENPIKLGWFGGFPIIFGLTPIWPYGEKIMKHLWFRLCMSWPGGLANAVDKFTKDRHFKGSLLGGRKNGWENGWFSMQNGKETCK